MEGFSKVLRGSKPQPLGAVRGYAQPSRYTLLQEDHDDQQLPSEPREIHFNYAAQTRSKAKLGSAPQDKLGGTTQDTPSAAPPEDLLLLHHIGVRAMPIATRVA